MLIRLRVSSRNLIHKTIFSPLFLLTVPLRFIRIIMCVCVCFVLITNCQANPPPLPSSIPQIPHQQPTVHAKYLIKNRLLVCTYVLLWHAISVTAQTPQTAPNHLCSPSHMSLSPTPSHKSNHFQHSSVFCAHFYALSFKRVWFFLFYFHIILWCVFVC